MTSTLSRERIGRADAPIRCRLFIDGVTVHWSPVGDAASRLAADQTGATKHLHEWEKARLATLRDPHRRATFLAGRTAAKNAICEATGLPPQDLAVLSWDRRGRGRRPTVWLRGRRLPGRVSITHDEHQAAAVWSETSGTAAGLDLGPVSGSLRPSPLWFGDEEQVQLLSGNDSLAVASLAYRWFLAKEAVFKLSAEPVFRPRDFEVSSAEPPHNHEPAAVRVRQTGRTQAAGGNYTVSMSRQRLETDCVLAVAHAAQD